MLSLPHCFNLMGVMMFVQLKETALISALAAFTILTTNSVHAQEFMTQKELLATLPGNTAYGIANGDGKTRWVQNYGKGRKKGKIAGLYGEEQYKAKWSVDGNLWCEDWGTGSGCWKFERVGTNQLRVYENGKPLKNLWTVK